MKSRPGSGDKPEYVRRLRRRLRWNCGRRSTSVVHTRDRANTLKNRVVKLASWSRQITARTDIETSSF